MSTSTGSEKMYVVNCPYNPTNYYQRNMTGCLNQYYPFIADNIHNNGSCKTRNMAYSSIPDAKYNSSKDWYMCHDADASTEKCNQCNGKADMYAIESVNTSIIATPGTDYACYGFGTKWDPRACVKNNYNNKASNKKKCCMDRNAFVEDKSMIGDKLMMVPRNRARQCAPNWNPNNMECKDIWTQQCSYVSPSSNLPYFLVDEKCRNWCLDNPRECDNAKKELCLKNPTAEYCRCINKTKDNDYNLLNKSDPVLDACWFVPCKLDNELYYLQLKENQPTVTCPTTICKQMIELNAGRDININNMTNTINCGDPDDPTPLPPPPPPPPPPKDEEKDIPIDDDPPVIDDDLPDPTPGPDDSQSQAKQNFFATPTGLALTVGGGLLILLFIIIFILYKRGIIGN